ncbi:MAG: hypothetical protein IPM57_10875 [Oligoflexia bacterium]|nr:hypothetical protein [Oligoflexia bacterium]
MKVIFLVLLLVSNFAHASKQWRCYSWKAELADKEIIFYSVKNNKEFYRWPFDHELQILLTEPNCLKAGSHTYLIAKLTSGAHSQKIVVLEPTNKTNVLAFEKTSVDDIDYEILEGKIKITSYNEKSIQDPSPVEEVSYWP